MHPPLQFKAPFPWVAGDSRRYNPRSVFNEPLEPATPGGMPKLSERFGFNLTDPFPGDGKILADFFQCMIGFFTDSKAHSENFFLPGRKCCQDLSSLFCQVQIYRRF